MRRLALLAFVLSSSAPAFANQPAMWRLEAIAKSEAPAVQLHKGPNRTYVGTLSTLRARLIVEVKTRLESQTGVAADLVLIEGNRPNAFSTPTSKAGPIVGLNLGMIELLGDDRDAYAAVLGHEYAHLTLRHREARMGRESLRLLGTAALAIALGSRGMNHGAADVANLTTQAISTTFSREEERDADRAGLRYAAAAGFDPYGAVRTWERMSAGGDRSVPFLSSHPASAERVENMRRLAGELAPSATAAEAEYLEHGVRIHKVLFSFSETHSRVFVLEMPEDASTTLRRGDRLVGCYGAAQQGMTLSSLSSCRSPDGAYAFVVERGLDQVSAVLLRPRQ